MSLELLLYWIATLLAVDHVTGLLLPFWVDFLDFFVQNLNLLVNLNCLHAVSMIVWLSQHGFWLIRNNSFVRDVDLRDFRASSPLSKHEFLVLGFKMLLSSERLVLLRQLIKVLLVRFFLLLILFPLLLIILLLTLFLWKLRFLLGLAVFFICIIFFICVVLFNIFFFLGLAIAVLLILLLRSLCLTLLDFAFNYCAFLFVNFLKPGLFCLSILGFLFNWIGRAFRFSWFPLPLWFFWFIPFMIVRVWSLHLCLW